jgi:2-polyprenyl-3-methyl-5-hydroxy-6-metoxy-1,4-benzoquinol methylase
MQYDPIKQFLGGIFNKSPFSRKVFYKLLDLLLLRTWHIRKELRMLKKTTPAAAHILDAGAGFGQYTYYLSGKFPGASITAIDMKKEQVEDNNAFFKKIGKSHQVRFVEGDLLELSHTGSFHLAICIDVMEHIEDDVAVLKNIQRSLKTGGVLLISTPSDKGGSDVHNEQDASFIEEHVRDGYSIQDMTLKLQTAGFSKIMARYSYGTPGRISWKWSMKYPILMINASKLFYFFLPFYYLITLPFCMLMNLLDVHNFHKSGTGLIVKAIK